jgi:hypothetical protein
LDDGIPDYDPVADVRDVIEGCDRQLPRIHELMVEYDRLQRVAATKPRIRQRVQELRTKLVNDFRVLEQRLADGRGVLDEPHDAILDHERSELREALALRERKLEAARKLFSAMRGWRRR